MARCGRAWDQLDRTNDLGAMYVAVLDRDIYDTGVVPPELTHYANALIGAVLQRTDAPVLLLDRRLAIVYVAPQAEAVLRDGRHIARRADGHLLCSSERSAEALRRYLADLHAEAQVDIVLHGAVGDVPLFASLVALQPPAFGVLPPPPLLILMRLRNGSKLEVIDVARTLYDLSKAEAEAVRAIVSGVSIKQHAEQRQVSVHTVRKQLNAAMRKTRVSSQLELQTLIHDLTRRPESAVRG